MYRGILCILTLTLTLSCSSNKPPKIAYQSSDASIVPNYADTSSWSALPETVDYADRTPAAIGGEAQADAEADVFFIHPTTYFKRNAWNAQITNLKVIKSTDARAVKHQASVFNHSCRVFAPRYRQMVYGGFFSFDSTNIGYRNLALELAYQDVKAAFQYYLKHHNEGRPIVIASHSQGSFHGIRLMKEFFDGKPLQDQLVAAYLIGWPFTAQTFEHLPLSNAPDETGCVMGWNSWKKGTEPKKKYHRMFFKNAVVTNPLTWRTDTTYAGPEQHEGMLMGNYKKVKEQHVDAQAHGGILWVKNPIPLAPIHNFHVADYNLFWLDIRTNVADRVDAFIAKQDAINGVLSGE